MRKVAIVEVHSTYNSWVDSSESLIRHITEWEEIPDEDFDLLSKYINSGRYSYQNYHADSHLVLIELPLNQKERLKLLVSEYVEQARKDKKEEEKAAAKEAERKRKYKETKKTREVEKAKKILEKYGKNSHNSSDYEIMNDDDDSDV